MFTVVIYSIQYVLCIFAELKICGSTSLESEVCDSVSSFFNVAGSSYYLIY